MMVNPGLDSWLKPSTTPKRKRDDAADASEKENTAVTASASRKKAKPAPASNPKAKVPTSVGTGNKEATELYNETLKAVDKRVSELDKKVKAMSGNSWSITTATYATSAGKHIKAAQKLADMDTTLGFNLLLSLADASHTDLDATCKMCGESGDSSIDTFTALDKALLPLIEKRKKEEEKKKKEKQPQPGAGGNAVLPSVPARWTRADADVGPFKTPNGPNKQQRGQMYSQKLEWEKRRTAARRARREAAGVDWVAVALADLKEERDYLDAYGVEQYLPESIARLEELVAADDVAVSV